MLRLKKRQIIYIMAFFIVILQLIFGENTPQTTNNLTICKGQACQTSTITIDSRQTVKVVRIIDGDTIEIEGKKKVRYIGIDTPEIYHDATGKKTGEQCFAGESYLENKRLVEGKTIILMKDVSDKDKYGRLLRYVYVDDIFVNDYLLKNGFAKLMTIKPDIKHSLQFKEAQIKAKTENLGIWKMCN